MTTNEEERGWCGQSELLVTVLYGEATPEERERFEAHRRACAACDEEFASFSAVRRQLGGWELEAIPHVRVEVRPGIVERLKRAFVLLPMAARIAAAGACALVVLAALNTEVSVGSGGVALRAHLLPSAPPPVVAGPQLSEADVRRIVAERVDASVREQLVAYRADMEAQLADMQTRLASAKSSDDVRRLTVQVSAQQKRIERLQRDLDRTAGYGGSDLFSVVLNPAEPGS